MNLYYKREAKITKKYDLVVVGGGVAGVSAAVIAKRQGLNVALIEKCCNLGGLATLGLVIVYLPLCDGNGKQVVSGFNEELFELSLKYSPQEFPVAWTENGPIEDRKKTRYKVRFNASSFALALNELVVKEEIDIFYDSRAIDVLKSNNKIEHVIIENKSGSLAIPCRFVVDATGDADISYFSGEKTCSYDDNRKTGWFYQFIDNDIKLYQLNENLLQPIKANSRGYRGDDGKDVSDFVVESHKIILEKTRSLSGDFKKDYPVTLPTIPQFRMTRRLMGKYEMSMSDENVKKEDSIGINPNWRRSGSLFEIPYFSLIGETENLLVAGRCISAKQDVLELVRDIPGCVSSGEACGYAVSMLIEKNINSVQQVDVKLLRKYLAENKVIL